MGRIQLGWIDYSSEHRNKVMAVLHALTAPGAVDELGIGQIRDGFANLLFPGTSKSTPINTGRFSFQPPSCSFANYTLFPTLFQGFNEIQFHLAQLLKERFWCQVALLLQLH